MLAGQPIRNRPPPEGNGEPGERSAKGSRWAALREAAAAQGVRWSKRAALASQMLAASASPSQLATCPQICRRGSVDAKGLIVAERSLIGRAYKSEFGALWRYRHVSRAYDTAK
jgi:hypothetical protein